MSDQTYQITAILLYFAGMLGIGYYAYRRTANVDGYMLAERQLTPTMAALSANAADMSGWLLMGLPGAIYTAGLIKAWIAIGLTVGAWVNWRFIAPRLRAYSEITDNAITIPSFFAKRLKRNSRQLRIVAALVILVFFTFYVSSGMVAAGKFFVSSFGWNYFVGMFVVALITLAYTLFGGFLGATLTDVAQGLLMLAALIAVPIVTVVELGGWSEATDRIADVKHEAFNLFSGFSGNAFVWIVATISTAAWGLGYFGQPHIIVRFMALRSPGEAKTARRISLFWMVLTASGAIFTALIGIGYFAGSPEIKLGKNESEEVFLVMSRIFFHPFVAGLVLAAVLAAIMSTASAQLLVAASAFAQDIYRRSFRPAAQQAELVWVSRLSVLAIAAAAIYLGLSPDNFILDMVAYAWAGFGAAFGPALLMCLFWRRVTERGVLAGIVTGGITVLIWKQAALLGLYEIVPGFLLAFLAIYTVSKMDAEPPAKVTELFDRVNRSG